MFSRIILAIALVSSVAAADSVSPGRCVVASEPGKADRMLCNTPPSEQCTKATIVRLDGSIVTRTMCVYTSR